MVQEQHLVGQAIDLSLLILIEEEYEDTLRQLLAAKLKLVKASNDYERKDKAARYAIGKGYEPALVWEVLSS